MATQKLMYIIHIDKDFMKLESIGFFTSLKITHDMINERIKKLLADNSDDNITITRFKKHCYIAKGIDYDTNTPYTISIYIESHRLNNMFVQLYNC